MAWAKARAGAGDETDQAWERLAGFRRELYRCFTARADALSELCDAALCKQDRVHMLADCRWSLCGSGTRPPVLTWASMRPACTR